MVICIEIPYLKLIEEKHILLKIMIIPLDLKQKTCRGHSLCLLGGEVGLLLIRSRILGNEVR